MWKTVEVIGAHSYPGAELGEFKVYVIRNNLNGKEYVGITVSPLAERLRGHRAAARSGLNSKLYNAMRRHGPEHFSIELVRCDARNFAELQEHEVAEIKRRETLHKGYNTSPGGSIGTAEEISVAGVTYPSRGAAAEHFGIDVTVFNIRISRLGWSPEQAAEIEPRMAFARHRIEVNGKQFKSLKSAAEHFGLDYKVVHSRVRRDGWTAAQALERESPPPRRSVSVGKRLSAFGQDYPSIAACARAHGLKALSLRRRVVGEGEAVESAIEALKASKRLGLRKPGQRKQATSI